MAAESRFLRPLGLGLLVLTLLGSSGCASLISGAQQRLADQLTTAVKSHDDPQTVAAGLAAYLLLADAGVEGAPQDPAALCGAAGLYATYAGSFVDADPERSKRLSERAFGYALRGACAADASACGLREARSEAVLAWAESKSAKQTAMLACVGPAWAGWIQARSEDYSAIADVPKVRAIFERLAAIDPTHDGGNVQLYLGVLNTLLPEAYGGKPEQGRAHFEQAIALSEGRNLMAKTLYARHYARLMFDQALHDRLLDEVLAAPVQAGPYTLANALAQRQAAELKIAGADYF